MSRIFAVTSGKGGVGKSTVAVGLASAFAARADKVLLVDMDEGFRCLDLMLGIDSKTVFDLSDILGGKDIDDAAYACDTVQNLYLIPAASRQGLIDVQQFKEFAQKAACSFDIVIFDFPAGINLSLYCALPEDTIFLTVAVPDPISIRDAYQISRMLSECSLPARLIINRFIHKQSRRTGFKNIDSIIDSSGIRLLGIIPESEDLAMLSVTHKLKKHCRSLSAFKRIAARLSGEQQLLPKLKKI